MQDFWLAGENPMNKYIAVFNALAEWEMEWELLLSHFDFFYLVQFFRRRKIENVAGFGVNKVVKILIFASFFEQSGQGLQVGPCKMCKCFIGKMFCFPTPCRSG